MSSNIDRFLHLDEYERSKTIKLLISKKENYAILDFPIILRN